MKDKFRQFEHFIISVVKSSETIYISVETVVIREIINVILSLLLLSVLEYKA